MLPTSRRRASSAAALRGDSPAAGRHARGAHHRARILIADDEPALRELVRLTLDDGYELAEAEDGQACLERARALQPQLLILDLMMPRLNGLDVLAHRRDDAALRKVAVLVLTAQPSLGRQALDLGADRVIAKPFDPDQLADTVDALIADQTH